MDEFRPGIDNAGYSLSPSTKIHKAEEGGYWAEFPDLPGCVAEGDTEEELLKMAKDALSGWLAVRFERNFSIPEAKSLMGKNVRWVEPSPDVSIPLMIRKIRTELGPRSSCR